jgi:AcrR family transcriptional regulator
MLLREGAAAVKVERIATALNVTRGGFYWRFRDHADLMDALLEDWRETNSRSMMAALNGPGTPVERIWALMDVWVDEIGYDPDYDIAVRAWATISNKVARVVRAVDKERIDAMHRLFVDYGYDDTEAFIRARVLYFHQVGYYAMGVKEPKAKRHDLLKHYYKVLTGFGDAPAERLPG